jgi:hypothetical protein
MQALRNEGTVALNLGSGLIVERFEFCVNCETIPDSCRRFIVRIEIRN